MNLPTPINLVVPVAGFATHGQYALVEASVAAGTEIPTHVAHREDVVLHVLHGELAVNVDRTQQTVTQGASVSLPRGVPRRLVATRPSRVLALIAPAGLEQVLNVIADPATDPDDRAALLAVGGVQALPAA
ncbi:cupin domain-containing protein [Solirubrobacter sp. CPCC 204708]|uniref:Cupin domain-containing protein n=1 Tax=Solirubrobacter deserti TaxID=2282478 RepID=A0ABT4RHP7_9ACTN|nr:cupin domain-containing protein [Solirubrobacter deserti]MBE2316545.1 cupin domain-containing protein [Solirubrobacter deserti]MDA0138079.1 cupin domain-containing protein [Solirubrobacter deserti]